MGKPTRRMKAYGYGAVAPNSALRTVEVTAARERQSNGKSFMVLLAGVLVLGVFLSVNMYPSAPSMYSKPQWYLITQPKAFCRNQASVRFVVHLLLWAALHFSVGRGEERNKRMIEAVGEHSRRRLQTGKRENTAGHKPSCFSFTLCLAATMRIHKRQRNKSSSMICLIFYEAMMAILDL